MNRQIIRDTTALLALALVTAVLLGMCTAMAAGCGASARQKTIRLTYESTNIANDELLTFTKVHSKAITDDAKAKGETKEQASAELETFLGKAEHAQLTVNAVYRMVAAASALNDDKSLATLLQVAEMLAAELKELGVLK